MSDEVSQFLEQVERLRGQQIEDDEMRAREREEFLAAKRERQARREERARSISPQKSSPAATPSPHANRRTVYLAEGLRLDSPGHEPHPLDKMREKSVEPGKPGTITTVTTTEIDAPPLDSSEQDSRDHTSAKASPFPWQRRPSRVGARPLSMIATHNATHNATERSRLDPGPGPGPGPGLQDSPVSRDQIAQSLASHDPSWFRQTPDRGATSAAYRKNQVEVQDDDRLDLSPARAQLPGMATESRESREARDPSSAQERTPGTLAEPLLPLLPQLTGRPNALRSGSPTKGMGGFVQSALMKRSDSVKRWSVASPAGLTRGDSIATNRGSVANANANANAAPAPRPKSVIDTSFTTTTTTTSTSTTTAPPLSARPASRHSEKEASSFEPAPSEQNPPKTPTRTSPVQTRRITIPEEDPSFPLSPSKTMDPRRWSPIKSSWLESALNRPEVPQKPPQHSKTSSQPPAWMAELNKTRERPGHRHQVSISGLKTSSPMGTVTTLNPKGLGGIYSPPVAGNRASTLNLSLVPESTSSSSHPSHHPAADHDSSKGRDDGKLERKASVLSSSSASASASAAAAAAKPKPVTPPKKDFRANLKPRAAEPQDTKSAEPEFKAVFGTLRRAKTQNFKAPDELKDNILRGKASLNLTDGPHKSVIRDDFREAILRKKASFARAKVEGKGVVTNAAAASAALEKPVPEGLAKRAEIRQTQTQTQTMIPTSARQSAPALTHVRSPPRPKPEVERREVVEQGNSKPQAPATSPRDLRSKKSAPSRLGDRFNPALAGLLARGPPIESNEGGRGGGTGAAESSGPGPQLTHMTKNRARGPKRRAPTTAPSTPTASAVSLPDFGAHRSAESLVESRPGSISAQVQQSIFGHRRQPTAPEKIVTDLAMPLRPVEGNATPQAESPRKLDLRRMSKFMDSRTPTGEAMTGSTHGRTGSWSPTKAERQGAEAVQGTTTTTTTTTPRRHLRGESVQSVKNAAAMFGGSAVKAPMPGPRISTLFLPQESVSASLAPVAQKVPPPRPVSPKPVIAAKPVSPKALPPQTQEPTSPRAANLFNDFFELPHRRKPFEVDTSEILNNRQDLGVGAKIHTITFHMCQITPEGKQMPIQQQNQRVLFEQEMYLASHTFTNEAGWKVREMYLWIGDDVLPDHALEATHSALREAEHAGSKLVSMSQGKETAEFLQALGGVVLVRRRSSIKYDSLAPSMLCGRGYLGQVVFDEVDFESGSLCSGFAYLVAHSGTCVLWKGKGSAVEELSCARLVGMELSLTGELVEYEDGGEPTSFWEMLNGRAGAHSADHWRLKPSYERYASRLFCSDEDSKEQIYEVAPFTQLDLSPTHIYILDAFFEIYIIVGSRAQPRYASFRNALDFAQEYAIVAAGAEDRPFVPISTVVLEGAPRDLKRVFRKWVDRHCPTVLNGSGNGSGGSGSKMSGPALRRVRSLKIVPLTQALMALQE